MADMQKGRDVLQGMAVCNGELNKLSAKVPYQRGRRTCNEQGSLIVLLLLREQPVLSHLDGTVPQPDDGGCLQTCDDRHFHCKRAPADACNTQAPDHCSHNKPPTNHQKEVNGRFTAGVGKEKQKTLKGFYT